MNRNFDVIVKIVLVETVNAYAANYIEAINKAREIIDINLDGKVNDDEIERIFVDKIIECNIPSEKVCCDDKVSIE